MTNEELLVITNNEIRDFSCSGEFDDGYVDYDRDAYLRILKAQRDALIKLVEVEKSKIR